ncbi:MAG: Uncharacterized protein G01um101438_337 [Parcubacteria group bacterium Gr01-1014_38]|nr:MAG: Uncharacterized protein G01um101438_337 [Parcubacteria group bacterium Gr01-1014_38]
MEILDEQQIIERRRETEQGLVDLLEETGSDFGLDDIKEIIFNEDGQDDLTDIIAMFDTGQGAAELQDVLDLVTDAWNCFPHKSLGGLSPAEKVLAYQQRSDGAPDHPSANTVGGVGVFVCRCDDPHCAKCLLVNCEDNHCSVHTKERKEAFRRTYRQR